MGPSDAVCIRAIDNTRKPDACDVNRAIRYWQCLRRTGPTTLYRPNLCFIFNVATLYHLIAAAHKLNIATPFPVHTSIIRNECSLSSNVTGEICRAGKITIVSIASRSDMGGVTAIWMLCQFWLTRCNFTDHITEHAHHSGVVRSHRGATFANRIFITAAAERLFAMIFCHFSDHTKC